MLTVRIIYNDGTETVKDCWNVDEICLDNVKEIKTIRDEKRWRKMTVHQIKSKIQYYKCFRDEKSRKLVRLYNKLLTKRV